ncbi:methyltransferase domain-containing protein [Actinocatenispora comari]|uniref:Protein-L-isoaspartate O-methyltransferase n=1 Tax=Actinocatenispora comari TaxID=2807577 RepID=A0A8J4AK50_9ACTN|nr:methyltransferase domain-containing protein [Actinocatenispora comari]GIL32040.1 protein-L-isoaspartate O-methyltransferase [Actinocatenispora comari]
MAEWQHLVDHLADELVQRGQLTDPLWQNVFRQTPRHLFLPDRDLADAYANDAVVTQQRPAPVAGGEPMLLPTSSASAPSAVAVMLDRLEVQDGDRVLEIGTGTGYNTALLCGRLGDDHVVSIDLDPDLVDTARTRLAELGFGPRLVARDGTDGVPDGAPYDRILATCAVTQVPPAWIRQLAPNGRLVAPLHGAADAALMVFDKTADDEVTGRFDPELTSFMPLRPQLGNPLVDGGTIGWAVPLMAADGTTTLDPVVMVDPDPDLALFVHLHIPSLAVFTTDVSDGPRTISVGDSTAVAEVNVDPTSPGVWTVHQRGPRRLWDTVEHAVWLWGHLGKPRRDRYGISALDRTDRQYIWLDDPYGPYSWPLPL